MYGIVLGINLLFHRCFQKINLQYLRIIINLRNCVSLGGFQCTRPVVFTCPPGLITICARITPGHHKHLHVFIIYKIDATFSVRSGTRPTAVGGAAPGPVLLAPVGPTRVVRAPGRVTEGNSEGRCIPAVETCVGPLGGLETREQGRGGHGAWKSESCEMAVRANDRMTNGRGRDQHSQLVTPQTPKHRACSSPRKLTEFSICTPAPML